MNQRYVLAKNAALGIEEGTPLPPSHNYKDVVIGQRAQTGVELFSKTFNTPPELIVRKSVLSLFEEYETDYDNGHKVLRNVLKILDDKTIGNLENFLNAHKPIEWFNCIFLEDEEIDELILALENTNEDNLKVFLQTIQQEIQKLVNFKDLYSAVLRKWKRMI
jgi:hypothetical protein